MSVNENANPDPSQVEDLRGGRRGRRHHPAAHVGRIEESAFTHGSAQQRRQWFSQGFQSADPRQRKTFA